MDYGPNEPAERYTVFYAETMQDGRDTWVTYLSTDEDGRYSHGELKAHELAAYRYRKKHRYTRWSDLPDAVKNVVRRDLEVAR